MCIRRRIFIFFLFKKKTRWPKAGGGLRQGTFLYSVMDNWVTCKKNRFDIFYTTDLLQLRELLDKIHQLPQAPSEHNFPITVHKQNRPQVLHTLNATTSSSSSSGHPVSPGEFAPGRTRRARGKMYMPLGLPSTRNKPKRWLSRSAPTTPSGTIPMSLFPGQSRRPSETENYGQQFVPLLAEQDENDINTLPHCQRGLSLPEQEEESQQLWHGN